MRVLSLVGTLALALSVCDHPHFHRHGNQLACFPIFITRARTKWVGWLGGGGGCENQNEHCFRFVSLDSFHSSLINQTTSRSFFIHQHRLEANYTLGLFCPSSPRETEIRLPEKKPKRTCSQKVFWKERENIFAYFSRELGNECTNCRPAANANKQVFHSLVRFYSKRLIRYEKLVQKVGLNYPILIYAQLV